MKHLFVMSDHLHMSAWLPLDRFPWNFLLGTFTEIWRGTPNVVKILNFTWRRKYVLVLPATLNCHKSDVFACIAIRLLEYRRGINFTQTCRNVVLYVHCLSCFKNNSLKKWNYKKFMRKCKRQGCLYNEGIYENWIWPSSKIWERLWKTVLD